MTPSGYLSSRDAFNAIGREKHGAAWDGEIEYRARSGLWSIEDYNRARVTPSRHSGSGAGAGGFRFGISKDDPADDPASETYQAERMARRRYDDVKSEFIRRLEAGVLKAAVLDYWTGNIKSLEREFWRTGEASQAVTRGIGPGGHGVLLVIDFRRSPDDAAQEPEAQSLPGAILPNRPQPKNSATRKRGPKISRRDQVKAKMLKFGLDEVGSWSEVAMAAEFGASRDTCRRALKELREESADN